ncbi:hypothetical protein D3C75_917170 [compost metagenome]
MQHPPTHSSEKSIPVQRITEFLAVHVPNMALETVAFDSEPNAACRQERKIQELRLPVPVIDFILRMQMVQRFEQRPPHILQKQLLRIIVPSQQPSSAFSNPLIRVQIHEHEVCLLKFHFPFPPQNKKERPTPK